MIFTLPISMDQSLHLSTTPANMIESPSVMDGRSTRSSAGKQPVDHPNSSLPESPAARLSIESPAIKFQYRLECGAPTCSVKVRVGNGGTMMGPYGSRMDTE